MHSIAVPSSCRGRAQRLCNAQHSNTNNTRCGGGNRHGMAASSALLSLSSWLSLLNLTFSAPQPSASPPLDPSISQLDSQPLSLSTPQPLSPSVFQPLLNRPNQSRLSAQPSILSHLTVTPHYLSLKCQPLSVSRQAAAAAQQPSSPAATQLQPSIPAAHDPNRAAAQQQQLNSPTTQQQPISSAAQQPSSPAARQQQPSNSSSPAASQQPSSSSSSSSSNSPAAAQQQPRSQHLSLTASG